MDYVLIKNGVLTNDGQDQISDILICDNKIIDVGPGLMRPDLETPVIDAGGKYLLPGVIDINRGFFHQYRYDHQRLMRLLQAQIISGTTFWLDALPIPELESAPVLMNVDSIAMPDYGFHLMVDGAFCRDPEAFFPMLISRGVSSLLFRWPPQEDIAEEKLVSVFEFVKEHGLLLVFELQFAHQFESGDNFTANDTVVGYHLSQLELLAGLVRKFSIEACFLNVHYVEELSILKTLRLDSNIYAELALSVTLGSREAFVNNFTAPTAGPRCIQPLTAQQVIQEVLDNPWCLVGRSGMNVFNEEVLIGGKAYNRPDDYFNSRYFLSVLSSIPLGDSFLLPHQMADVVARRPSKLFNLFPVKGNLKPGGDADLIIWDPLHERNLFVSYSHAGAVHTEYKLRGRAEFIFMNGRIVYNGEQILNDSQAGVYLCRNR